MAQTRSRPASKLRGHIRTIPYARRRFKFDVSVMGKVPGGPTMSDFLDSLPRLQKAGELREVASRVIRARAKHKPVILAFGAHVIKCGLQPVIRDLMERGFVTLIATNGAGAIHDFEIAFGGATSEWVEEGILDGTFGFTRETGRILNRVARRCLSGDIGLGEAIAEHLLRSRYRFKGNSVFATARRLSIPATVHVAIGCDVTHMHPNASGAALGAGSLRDFHRFAAEVARLGDGGVFFNIGSSVIVPEVFLKAVSMARNRGARLRRFTTVNMDFLTHYRPAENVLRRPHERDGDAFNLIGPHEIMVPLLAAAIRNLAG